MSLGTTLPTETTTIPVGLLFSLSIYYSTLIYGCAFSYIEMSSIAKSALLIEVTIKVPLSPKQSNRNL